MKTLQANLWIVCVALFLLSCSAAACGDTAETSESSTITMLPGIAEPSQMVELSAPMDGVLRRIHVKEGQTVQVDQLLASLDDRVAQAAKLVAERTALSTNKIRQAKTQLNAARTYLQRIEQAHANGAASDLELDEAKSRVHDAEATLHQADEQKSLAMAQLALEEQRLESHYIRAPFPGRVIQIDGKTGQSMMRAESVLRIANFRTLRAELHIPIEWFGKLKTSEEYQLVACRPVNRRVLARMISCEPIINTATNTFRCVFEIDNSDKSLPAGFAVRLVKPKDPAKHIDHSNQLESITSSNR